MAKYTLSYFDFSASRGEDCRLALHVAGVAFDDDRIKGDDWPARKAETPFHALPVLTVEGQGKIAQSNAILVYVGRTHDLHPKDAWEAARHEMVLGAVEDFRAKLGPIARMKDADEKKRARQEVAAGYMQEWGADIERQIHEGPFLAGAHISVADIKLFVAISAFAKGTIDHIPADVFKAFPKLTRLYQAASHHEKIVDWYARK